MSIITISSIFNFEYDDYKTYCNTVIGDFITTTPYEDTLDLYIYLPIWLRYRDTPIKFSNDDKGKDAFLRNFNNQLTEVVFDFHNYAKENIEYFLYQNDTTKQGKPMSKTITSGIAPINQKIDQAVDSTNLASGTGSQFVSETVYNGIAWHKLVEGYFTPNRKTALLKAFQWLFISVYSPETKYNDKIGIKATVPLDMADGDQVIVPDKDYLTYDQVTVEKPDTMIPENIVKDIDIGGVVGTYEPQIYPRIYDVLRLDNPEGIIGYNTPSGYDGIEGVTISIPSTAVPENIKQGVNIGGIIGTYYNPDYLQFRITTTNTRYVYENNNVVTMRQNAFRSDENLIEFSSTSLESGANVSSPGHQFNGCVNLEKVTLPAFKYGQTYMFANCTSLKNVYLPSLVYTGTYFLYRCTALETVTLNDINTLEAYSFQYCTSLQSIDLKNCIQIGGGYVFANCTNLTDVYLRRTGAVVNLQQPSAFGNIPNTVTIHVPSDLISTYQTATNWSVLYNNNKVTFVAI